MKLKNTKLFFNTTIAVILIAFGCNQVDTEKSIPDGLYLIVKIDTIANERTQLFSNQKEVFYSKMFDEYNSEGYQRIIIDTTQYAPLELKDKPQTEQDSDKKKLLLSLSPDASKKLKTFTTKHVNKMVTLIVDGEALTSHMIRVPITGGHLQISRCNDNACELLYETLKDNVKQ